MQDMLTVPDWNDILTGTRRSRIHRRRRRPARARCPTAARSTSTQATNMVNCGKTDTCCGRRDERADTDERPGARTTRDGSSTPTAAGGHDPDRHGHVADVRRRSGSPTTRRRTTTTRQRRQRPRDRPPSNPARRAVMLRARRSGPNGASSVIEVDRGPHRHHRDRARLHRPARSGRTEPPRTQGAGPDARQGADAIRSGRRAPVDSGALRQSHDSASIHYRRIAVAAPRCRGRAATARGAARSAAVSEDDPPNVILAVDTGADAARRSRHLFRSGHLHQDRRAALEAVLGLIGARIGQDLPAQVTSTSSIAVTAWHRRQVQSEPHRSCRRPRGGIRHLF